MDCAVGTALDITFAWGQRPQLLSNVGVNTNAHHLFHSAEHSPVRAPADDAAGQSHGSSRAKVTKGGEDGDGADEGDAASSRFTSAFAAGACVINFGTHRKSARKAPFALSVVSLVKLLFESTRIADPGLNRQEYRGKAVSPHSEGAISATAVATSRPLKLRHVSMPNISARQG